MKISFNPRLSAFIRVPILIFAAVIILSWQYAPSVIEQRRDSGIFAYTGKVVADGGLPYVDAWDNKLPGVYYIDALAFTLFGANRWALWLIENMFLTLAALVLYGLLKQVGAYGDTPLHAPSPHMERRPGGEVWLGPLLLILFLRHPALVSDVNFTEPYALLPQITVFAAGYHFLRQPSYRFALLIGTAAALALLIKQTTIAVALMFIPAVLISRHPILKSPRRWLMIIIAGGLGTLGLVAFYLAANGILDDALQASFVDANQFHHWVGGSAWFGETIFTTLTATAFPLVFGPFLPFLIIGIAQAFSLNKSLRAPRLGGSSSVFPDQTADAALAIWAALTFGLDVFLANITNRGYEHYYITPVPAAIILIMLSLPIIRQYAARGGFAARLGVTILRLEVILLFALVPIIASVGRFWMADWTLFGPERHKPLAVYVAEHTDPGDFVLVWGVDVVIHFQSGRNSPTAYHHGYPLIVPGDTARQRIAQVIADLNRRRPVMIVDTTRRDGDRIPPLDPAQRQQWWADGGRRDTENLDPIYQFVAAHCRMVTIYDQATIYRCIYQD
jgi:hypothetical protein